MSMAKCEVCGNEYKRSFTVQLDNDTHIFDTFECAIQSLAPRCARCEVVIIGHGVEGDDEVFCGAHCARAAGETGAVDNVA
jgi:hypothetical protein